MKEQLEELLNIPVFHDDQHGTAIIAGAAITNALEITNRKFEDIKVVFTGAGAAALATAYMLVELGVKRENVWMFDMYGLVYQGREEDMFPKRTSLLNQQNMQSIQRAKRAHMLMLLQGADVFIGLSVGGIVTGDMLKKMNLSPVILRWLIPYPKSPMKKPKKRFPKLSLQQVVPIIPTVNNVLALRLSRSFGLQSKSFHHRDETRCCPCSSSTSQRRCTRCCSRCLQKDRLQFGPDYLIPKPFDPRVLLWIAPAVAEAAEQSGVAQRPIEDIDQYRLDLEKLMEKNKGLLQPMIARAQHFKRRIAFPDGEEAVIIRAASIKFVEEGIAIPKLIGRRHVIETRVFESGIPL